MNRLTSLLVAYDALDELLERERDRAIDDEAKKKIDDRLRLNDHAHLLLGWGYLEAEIDRKCREAIRKRRDNPDWTRRRGWDLYDPDNKRLSGLSLEDRVRLLIDAQAPSGEWKLAMHWYQLRNKIAHGGSHADRIDFGEVVKEFFLIQSALKP